MVGADCGHGDCGAFGATCANDALGLRCVSVFCAPTGDSTLCLPDESGDFTPDRVLGWFHREAITLLHTVPSLAAFVVVLREDLLKSGVLVKRGEEFLELTQNYEFSSPSGAAAFLIGSNVNGRDAWKTQNGQTLKHLQETASDS